MQGSEKRNGNGGRRSEPERWESFRGEVARAVAHLLSCAECDHGQSWQAEAVTVAALRCYGDALAARLLEEAEAAQRRGVALAGQIVTGV